MRDIVSVNMKEKKIKREKEKKILFIQRTWVTFIELYKLGWVERVLKILTHTWPVISIY
jgi:hypothetical protein